MILQILITFFLIFASNLFTHNFAIRQVKRRLQKEVEMPKVWIEKSGHKHYASFTYKGQSFKTTGTYNKEIASIIAECLVEMFEEQKQDIIDKI